MTGSRDDKRREGTDGCTLHTRDCAGKVSIEVATAEHLAKKLGVISEFEARRSKQW